MKSGPQLRLSRRLKGYDQANYTRKVSSPPLAEHRIALGLVLLLRGSCTTWFRRVLATKLLLHRAGTSFAITDRVRDSTNVPSARASTVFHLTFPSDIYPE